MKTRRSRQATDALTFAAGAAGFAFVDVRPRYVPNRQTKTVDVVFSVREGPRVYVDRIDIVSNTRTLDYVVRRELEVAEGDAYNRVLEIVHRRTTSAASASSRTATIEDHARLSSRTAQPARPGRAAYRRAVVQRGLQLGR
jgi:hypothetical protein